MADELLEEQGKTVSNTPIDRASRMLCVAGVCLMHLDSVPAVGVWSDLDGPEVRAALKIMESNNWPVRYLDGEGIPSPYKVRAVDGEPVPLRVLKEMEQHPRNPWEGRDRMLKELGWRAKGIAWAEWKAAALNRLFQEQGLTGGLRHITAATVRHGEVIQPGQPATVRDSPELGSASRAIGPPRVRQQYRV